MKAEHYIFLCEGEPDTICALAQGLEAICQTGGAGYWSDSFNDYFRGREAVICYDADAAGIKGAKTAADSLAGAGVSVRVITWPDFMQDGQDLTDWFVTHGKSVAELLELVAAAEPWQAPVETAKTAADHPPASGPGRFYSVGDDGRRSFRPALLAAEILAEMELVTDRETGITYTWAGTHYKPVMREELESSALRRLEDLATSARARDAVDQVVRLSLLPEGETMNAAPHLLCLPNGMLDLDRARIIPHDRRYRATWMLPWEFDPRTPQDCPRFKRFLHETMEGFWPMRELQEFMGYCLWADNRYETALFVQGSKGSGKSTLLEVIQALVGEDHCSNVDLADLEDQFLRASLAHKRLNVYDEADTKMAFTTKFFNSIVTGSRIQARHLYKPSFEFRPSCKLVFASNRFPYTRSYDEALYDRLILLRLQNSFRNTAKQDVFLKDKLMAEMPGVFAWALPGLNALRQRGRLLRSVATKSALNAYRKDNNPLETFWEDRLTTDPEFSLNGKLQVTTEDLYAKFSEWAKANGYLKPMPVNVFIRGLREMAAGRGVALTPAKVTIQGKRTPVYKGLALLWDTENL